MMGKVIPFSRESKRRNQVWNDGYSDGYHGREAQIDMPKEYYTAFEVGQSDREEDNSALESGDLDLLDDEERKEIYGDESDRV